MLTMNAIYSTTISFTFYECNYCWMQIRNRYEYINDLGDKFQSALCNDCKNSTKTNFLHSNVLDKTPFQSPDLIPRNTMPSYGIFDNSLTYIAVIATILVLDEYIIAFVHIIDKVQWRNSSKNEIKFDISSVHLNSLQ